MSKDNEEAQDTKETDTVPEKVEKEAAPIATTNDGDIVARLAKAEKKIKFLTVGAALLVTAMLVVAVAGFCLRGFNDGDDRGGRGGPGGFGSRGNGDMMGDRGGHRDRPNF
jgi:hypothetical protein